MSETELPHRLFATQLLAVRSKAEAKPRPFPYKTPHHSQSALSFPSLRLSTSPCPIKPSHTASDWPLFPSQSTMKASSFLSLLALAIMTFMMLGTTALPGGHPLENRGLELDAKKKHSAANPPNTGWVLKWCKYTAPMIFQWDLDTFIKHRERNFYLGPIAWD